MLGCYDNVSNWGLCAKAEDSECEVRAREFPDALAEFLDANGYRQ